MESHLVFGLSLARSSVPLLAPAHQRPDLHHALVDKALVLHLPGSVLAPVLQGQTGAAHGVGGPAVSRLVSWCEQDEAGASGLRAVSGPRDTPRLSVQAHLPVCQLRVAAARFLEKFPHFWHERAGNVPTAGK